MEWLKLSSHFDEDDKVRQLSDKAFRTHVGILTFSARTESDGHYRVIGRIPRYFQELIDVGLLEHVEGTMYRVPQWEKWNPTHAQLESQRNAARNRMERSRSVRANTRRNFARSSGAEVEVEEERTEGSTQTSEITPVRPSTAARKRAASVVFEEEFWPLVPRKEGKGVALAKFVRCVVTDGVEAPVLVEGMRRFAEQMQREGRPRDKIAHPKTWLSEQRWTDDYTEERPVRPEDVDFSQWVNR